MFSHRAGASFLLAVALLLAGEAPRRSVTSSFPTQPGAQALTGPELGRLMAEAPKVDEVRLSPDATHVVYRVARGSIETNRYVAELLLQRLNAEGAPVDAPVPLDRQESERDGGDANFLPQWCPDSTCLTYFTRSESVASAAKEGSQRGLVRCEIATRRAALVPFRPELPPAAAGARSRTPLTSIGSDYRWSPRGHFLAFTGEGERMRRLDPRVGKEAPAYFRFSTSVTRDRVWKALFVLDVATGAVNMVSPDSLSVVDFDWAPDEHAIVFSAVVDPDGGAAVVRTDLYIFDRATRVVRPLVTRPGTDGMPVWSPDGKWIAFNSNRGKRTYDVGLGSAVVHADGGPVLEVGGDDDPRVFWVGREAFHWMPDARGFYYEACHHLTMGLVKVEVSTGRVTPTFGDEPFWDDNASFSKDGRWVAFTRESNTSPPELFIRQLLDGPPRQLTHVASDFPLVSALRVDRVEWPSRDGKFTIHGLLMTPRSAWNMDGATARVNTPLPTLLYLFGGPSMVSVAFQKWDGHNGAPAALAARGYAVLVPNTRGRPGYGGAFQRGVRDDPGAGRLPFEDAMAGLDLLVTRGIADVDRTGVIGHSHGGYLTAYAITQTTRFKAAVIHEGSSADWFTASLVSLPGTDWELLMRDLHGFFGPFEPGKREVLLAESPEFNMDRVSTPTMLQYGTGNLIDTAGAPLCGALRQLKLPSECLVYDEGHFFTRPAAVMDSLARAIAWMDFWVRDLPYPEAEKAREYSAWRSKQASRAATSRRMP